MKHLAAVVGVIIGAGRIASAGPVCIPKGDSRSAVKLVGTKLSFCTGEDAARKCFAIETTTGALATAPVVPESATLYPTATTTDTKSVVCQAGGAKCHEFKTKFTVDEGMGLTAVVSSDGTLAAAFSTNTIETYDVAKGKKLASFKSGPSSCSWVDFIGATIVVNNLDCGDGSGTAWLASAKGKRIAWVGEKTSVSAPALIDGTQYAMASRMGDKLFVQDVKTGKLASTIVLGATGEYLDPEVSATKETVVVLFGGDRLGDTAVVTLATGKVANFTGTRCK